MMSTARCDRHGKPRRSLTDNLQLAKVTKPVVNAALGWNEWLRGVSLEVVRLAATSSVKNTTTHPKYGKGKDF